jgi:hypothetical protein
MKVSLLAIGIPVCAIFFVSIMGLAREKTVWRFPQLIGAASLLMVVLAHIAEAFHLMPWMHWEKTTARGTIWISSAPFWD